MDQFRIKQHQQVLLYRELLELESRRKQAVDFAAELSTAVSKSARRIYQVALEKASLGRVSLVKATEVASDASEEAHRMQVASDLSRLLFAFCEGEIMLLRADICALKDPTE